MRIFSILILCFIATLTFASTVPTADDPTTVFNESDIVVVLAAPSIGHVVSIRPLFSPSPMKLVPTTVSPDKRIADYSDLDTRNSQRSRQTLLCTFLI